MIVDNDTFIEQLTALYKLQKTKKTGSVWVTFKQVKEWIKRSEQKEQKEGEEPKAPIGCLVRATNGTKKISTLVKSKEAGKFNDKLTKVMNTYFALTR